MQNKILSLMLSGVIILSSLLNFAPVYADSTGNTSLDINVIATNVDITVPANVACTIDPNQVDPEDRFTYGDLIITNNGTAPVDISISAFTDTNSTFENNITPDGLPDGKEWDNLSVADTLKYFALGIKANNASSWGNVNLSDYLYVPEVVGSNLIGTLNSGASGKMDLDASFGLAFREAKTFSYGLVFGASLSDLGGVETTTLAAGLYDASGNSLATWNDLTTTYGLDVSKDYTSSDYNTETSSMYYILNNNPGLATAKNIILDSSVTAIGDYAFYGCADLTTITIPDSVTDIGDYAFDGCTALTTVNYGGSFTEWTSVTKGTNNDPLTNATLNYAE